MSPTLNPDHLHLLTQGSAIQAAFVHQRGYQSLPQPEDLRDLGFSKAQAKAAPALGIPLWNVLGQRCGWQMRPDAPRQFKNGTVAKYEMPKGDRLILDVHPSVQPLIGDPHETLWLTEGVRKGDSLASQGACTIAFPGGVWGFRGTNEHGGKVILPDWDQVALNDRLIYVVYDSDIYTKPNVQSALDALYRLLRSRGARPGLVQWPEHYRQAKMGADDFFAQGHTLEDLVAMVPPMGPLPARATAQAKDPRAVTGLKEDKSHNLRPILFNILEVLTHDPHWTDVFGYDEFANAPTLTTRPPYLPATEAAWTVRPITDADDSETSNWLQRDYDLCAATSLVSEAIQTLAHRRPYHPVRDYLNGLVRHAAPSLVDTWLHLYCGAANTPYHRAVGRKTLIAAVARVFAPGCKADTLTILQGKQGVGKSTTWRTLAGDPWFSDTMPDIERKDAMEGLPGKWLIELGELAVMQRSEREALNRFLSALTDHYRPSYGRRAATFPRQTLFVGTTNKDAFLRDETGARRFWPVKVEGPCDIAGLTRDRDQLWAEAVALYKQGEIWHLTAEEEALAAAEQEDRFEVDPWEDQILEYVDGLPLEGGTTKKVTTQEIMRNKFAWDNPVLWTQANSKRIGAILRHYGWDHKPYRDAQQRLCKGYVLVTSGDAPVTGSTGNRATTGNTLSGNKNKAVTDVTDVTGSAYNREKDQVDVSSKTLQSDLVNPLQPLWENGVTTSNTGNNGEHPRPGPPPPASTTTPCFHCDGTVFWTNAGGEPVCQRCHPQPTH
jgi:predicted P-loop ATPase